MHTLSGKLALGLVLFLTIGLLATTSQRTAGAVAPAPPASPASEYTAWEEWSAPLSSSTFDITQCSPDAADGNHIQSGDMNGDGRPDLLCLLKHPDGRTNPYVQLAEQGRYSPWEAWYGAIDPGCDFDLVLVGDFNGDGLDDWLCTRVPWYGGWYETIYFASNGSGFSGPNELALDRMEQFNPARCQASFVADVNQDGREDAVCHYLYADNSSVTRVAQDATASVNWSARSPVAAPGSFRLDVCVALHSGDVNGDGRPDQICSYQYPGSSATWVQLAVDSQVTAGGSAGLSTPRKASLISATATTCMPSTWMGMGSLTGSACIRMDWKPACWSRRMAPTRPVCSMATGNPGLS